MLITSPVIVINFPFYVDMYLALLLFISFIKQRNRPCIGSSPFVTSFAVKMHHMLHADDWLCAYHGGWKTSGTGLLSWLT